MSSDTNPFTVISMRVQAQACIEREWQDETGSARWKKQPRKDMEAARFPYVPSAELALRAGGSQFLGGIELWLGFKTSWGKPRIQQAGLTGERGN